MYEEIFESIRQAAEKRNLRERTIQLYCSNIGYFLRCTGKPATDLTLEDADAFLTMKRHEGRSPETHNHYRASIKFLYKRVIKVPWDDEEVPAMKRERNLQTVLTAKGILFPSSWTGGYLDIASVNQFFKASAKKAGITRHVSSHACRHSFASHLFESGVDIRYIQSLLYNVLYHAASDTLCNLASDKKYLGADIGYICILNTWGSAMNFHPHIHAIVLGGGLDAGNRWKDNGEDFFLPVKVVSRVFRGKYLAELKRLWSEEKLEFHGTAEPYKNHYAFKELLNACYHKEWIPYCKKPFQSCRHICRKVRRSCRSHGERSLTGYRKSMRRL